MNHLKNALCYSSIVIHDKSSDLYTTVSTNLPAETLQAVITEANKKSSYMEFSFKATFQCIGDPRVQDIFERVLSPSKVALPDFYRSASQALYYEAVASGNPPPYSLNSPIYRGWAHTKLSKQLNESSISCRKKINDIPSGTQKDPYISQVAAILKATSVHPFTLKACCLHINGLFPEISPQEVETALCEQINTLPYLSILDPAFEHWAKSSPKFSSQEKATSIVVTNYLRNNRQLATLEAILGNIHRIIKSRDVHPATLQATAIQLSSEFKSSRFDDIESRLYEKIPFTLSSNLYKHKASLLSEAEQRTSDELTSFCSSLPSTSSFSEAGDALSNILKGKEVNPLTLEALDASLQGAFPASKPKDIFQFLFMPIGSSLYSAWASLFLEEEELECSTILLELLQSSYESIDSALTLIADRLEGETIHPITLRSLEESLEATFTTASKELISSKLEEYLIMPASSSLYRAWANAHLQGVQKQSSDLMTAYFTNKETLSSLAAQLKDLPISPIAFKAFIADLQKIYKDNPVKLRKDLALAFPMPIGSDLYAVFSKILLKGPQKKTSDSLIAYFSAKGSSESKQEGLTHIGALLENPHPATMHLLHITLTELFADYQPQELYEVLSMPLTSPLYDTWEGMELSGDQKEASEALVTLIGRPSSRDPSTLPQIASFLKGRDIHPLTLKALFEKIKISFPLDKIEEDFYALLDMPIGSPLYLEWEKTLIGEEKKSSKALTAHMLASQPVESKGETELSLEDALSDLGGILPEQNVHPLTLKSLHASLLTKFPEVTIQDIEESRKNAFVLL